MLADLKEAIISMADDISLAYDRFLCKFYKVQWKDIGSNMYQVYQESYNSHSLCKIINKGNIKFIPKFGDPKNICNCRPITLFNISYRIIAKALSRKS